MVFPRWTNIAPLVIGIILMLAFASIIFVFWYWFSPESLNVGYTPEQPIPFSHRLHAGELGIDCRYCHSLVEKTAHANIPSTETCMNCHKLVKKDSPEIAKIHKSFETNTPLEWIQVHKLADYSYFNHSRHVNSGISCVSCHGQVNRMDVVHQVEPLSMSWCLECHRSPEKHLRPKDKITQLDWKPEDQLAMGLKLKKAHNINPSEDCSTCHR